MILNNRVIIKNIYIIIINVILLHKSIFFFPGGTSAQKKRIKCKLCMVKLESIDHHIIVLH